MPELDLMTEPELAKMLKTSERSLRNARQSGDLTYIQIGRLIRYRIEDVTAFLNRATIANDPIEPTSRISRPRTTKERVEAIKSGAQRQGRAA